MFNWLKRKFRISRNRNNFDSAETEAKNIPYKNLILMESFKKEGMLYFCYKESVGGNAGSHKGFSCVGANFIFNRDNGRILKFTNYRESAKFNTEGAFRIMVFQNVIKIMKSDIKNTFFQIIDVMLPKNCNKEARQNIERSVALYNDKYKIKGIEI